MGVKLFPACAGVILIIEVRSGLVYTFPRMCGGDPAEKDGKLEILHFSPHVRG